MRFSAGADRGGSAYPVEFLHKLRVPAFEPLRALLGFDGPFKQARIMSRERDVSGFGIPKSRACAICLTRVTSLDVV